MERKITALLQKWKDSGDETALMVKGARQVGKTYIIDEFGTSNYDYYLKIDLRDERIDDDFWAGKQTELIQRITLRYRNSVSSKESPFCSSTRYRTVPPPYPP